MKKDLEKHIGYWLRYISNHVSHSFAAKLASCDMSVAEWVVLNLLSKQAESPAVLAQAMGITRGAVSKVLNKLFNKKLIDRVQSAADRRYQEISLTEKGKKILPKLMAIADENDHDFFGYLSEKEKAKIIKLLKDMVKRNKWNDIPID